MKKTDIKNQILSDPLKHIWRMAIRQNRFDVVGHIIDEHDISPSTEVTPYNAHPLTYMATRGDVCNPAAVITAQVFITKGTELSVKDRKAAVPADYALLSDSVDFAHKVVYETIRRELGKDADKAYQPNVDGVISTIMCRNERAHSIENLHRNLGQVVDRLWVGCHSPDTEIVDVSNAALRQLEDIELPKPLEMFVRMAPSQELNSAYQGYKQIQQCPDTEATLVDLARQRETVRFEEWQMVREL